MKSIIYLHQQCKNILLAVIFIINFQDKFVSHLIHYLDVVLLLFRDFCFQVFLLSFFSNLQYFLKEYQQF